MDIKLYQRGGDKTNFTSYKDAIQFFAEKLIPKCKRDNLDIKIRFIKFPKKDDKECAYVEQDKTNKYRISVNRALDFPYIIASLAHEMVHVKQGVTGKLIMHSTGFKWKGIMYKTFDNDDMNTYNSYEWEKEARSMETELVKEFFEMKSYEVTK